MSVREQMLNCSRCGQMFIGEPESIGLDFCSQECSDAWWEWQERGIDTDNEREATDSA